MAEKEYIERESVKTAMMDAMVFTGYQSLALDVIKYHPAADVAEVKHGEWITKETALGTCCICSVCGSCPTMEYRYCPYCGAKMDGKENG